MKNPILSLALILAGSFCAAATAAEDPLAGLRKEHPRLFISRADVQQIKELVKSDPVAKAWHDDLARQAERILNQKPVEHKLIGPRLLDKSRTALGRISTLSALYLIDGDRRYADRAKQEMFTVIEFPDWNPSHFLDTAEMSNAVGIGYDWLYDYLAPDERAAIRKGLIRNGLQPGLDGFTKNPAAWWTKATHNWGQVCEGGLMVGCLAIADEEPEVVGRLFPLALAAFRPPMRAFAPDGGIDEGPGYWNYATIYNVYGLAALESALGSTFDLLKMPGFPETGFFRIHAVGPIGRTFNYADAGDGAGTAAQMFWLARAFNQPAFAQHEHQLNRSRAGIFHLIWYAQLPQSLRSQVAGANGQLATDAYFKGVQAAFFRSAHNDAKALFVGVKGGNNRANHSHLDLGSFVLDWQGQRFAVDLGSDDYNLPAYFGKQRWTYYRLRTESHNTITLDGQNQSTDGRAPIVAYHSTDQRAHAVVDLTHGYRTQATRVTRGLAVIDRSQVLIQDEIKAKAPAAVLWNFLTPARIAMDGRRATLTQGDAAIELRILSPANATFKVVSANPPAPQRQQPNIRNLTIELPDKVTDSTIAVMITRKGAAAEPPKVVPLAQWTGRVE